MVPTIRVIKLLQFNVGGTSQLHRPSSSLSHTTFSGLHVLYVYLLMVKPEYIFKVIE